MITKNNKLKKNCCKPSVNVQNSTGAVYGLGFIGAAVYYISTAATVWLGVLGFFKAIFWPAFLVFAILKFIGA